MEGNRNRRIYKDSKGVWVKVKDSNSQFILLVNHMTLTMEEKLLKDIKKTGYHSELKAASILEKNGWFVIQNSYYLDREENKGREIDIIAVNSITTSSSRKSVNLRVVIEVKRSVKNQWVIFTSPYGGLDKIFQFMEMTSDLPKSSDDNVIKEVVSGHIMSQFERIGRSGYVAFKGSNQSNDIFKAQLTVSKALLETKSVDEKSNRKQSPDNRSLSLYIPIIIFDGLLFECYLEDGGELKIHKSDHLPLRSYFTSSEYGEKNLFIDVVTLEGFEPYLNNLVQWGKRIYLQLINQSK